MEVPLSDEAIDFLEEQIPELAEIALKQAYWQVLASGHSVLQAEDGALYRVFPNGKREFVKKLEPVTLHNKWHYFLRDKWHYF